MWFIILSPLLLLAVHKLAYWGIAVYPFDIPIWSPWILLGTSAVFAWQFHRYRVLTLVALLLGWWLLISNLSHMNPDLKFFWLRWIPPAVLIPLMWLPEAKLFSVRSILLLVSVLVAAAWVSFGSPVNVPMAHLTILGLDITTIGLYLLLWIMLVWFETLRSEWIGWHISAVGSSLFVFLIIPGQPSLLIPFTILGLMILVFLVYEIYEIAFHDQLTKIPGRRALITRLGTIGQNYTLAMVDIDHFKNFNDTHGHDVGDQVLKMVAARLDEVTGGGKSYRYGGEEFTILFSRKSVDEAMVHLEAIRERIANYQVAIRKPERPKNAKSGKKSRGEDDKSEVVSVTISIGVTACLPGEKSDLVMKRADEALYLSKQRGRNRVSKK